MIKEIVLDGRTIEYTLVRKKVKRLNIRIDAGKVIATCSPRESVGNVEDFMRSHSKYILAAIDKTLIRVNNSGRPVTYADGERVKVWGEWCVIRVVQLGPEWKRSRVTYTHPEIILEVPNPSDDNQRKAAYEKWKQGMVKGKLLEMTKYYYNLMLPRLTEKKCHSLDDIRFRQMKTKWGVCRPTQGVITYNYNLFEAPQEGAAYVVVHELCHLLEANHSSRFYAEVARVLPDYKQRQALLKMY